MSNLWKLAKASFGIIIPQDLVDNPIFGNFDLDEDTLLRVQSVSSDYIFLQDSSGTVIEFDFETLSGLEDTLKPQWVKLTPTVLEEESCA